MKTQKILLVTSLCLFLNLAAMLAQSNGNGNEWKAWSFETAGPVYASPLISDGIIYIGSLDSVFYAIDAKTGREKWRYQCRNTIQSTAAVHNNLIFFESGNNLIAIRKGGKLKWEIELYDGEVVNQQDPWDFQHSSPVIYDGVVYIGTEKGILIGVDAKSGETVFRCQTISESAIRATPLVSDGMVMYGDWEGVFYANRLENGTLAWKYDTKLEGTYPWPNSILSNLVVEGESVYFAGKSNRLYSLNVKTGKKNWHYSSPTDQWLIGGPVVKDDVVYLGSSDQRLFHAIDACTGKVNWITELDCRIWGSAAINENLIYIGSNSLYVIDKGSGAIQKQHEFPQVHEAKKYGEYTDRTANFHSSPVLYDSMIIIGSDDGNVYAISEL